MLSTLGNGGIVDLSDESSAYKKQAAFDPISLPFSKSKAPTFSNDWILGIGDGKYKNHGITPTNVNSTKSEFQKSYPNKNINFNNISNVKGLRYKNK